MSSQFADTSSSFVSRAGLWRAARPVLLLFAAVGLAAVALNPRWTVTTVIISGSVTAVLALACIVGHLLFREHPTRLTYILEVEVATILLVILTLLAGVIFVMAKGTERYEGKTTAYLIGLLAGAAVGLFAKDFLKSAENQSWLEMHYRFMMNRRFRQYFYRFVSATSQWRTDPPARWRPDGMMSEALAANSYVDQTGSRVSGWSHNARRARAITIRTGLAASPEPLPPG